MAAGRPYYQRNGGEFILGTVHMDLETRGAYSLLLDLLNDRDRPIPDEPRFVAGILNCSVKKWNAIRERLMRDGKIYANEAGELTNPRFEREHAKRHHDREKFVEAGKIGGRKSAEMRAAGQLEFEVQPILEPEKRSKSRPRVKDKMSERDTAPPENNDLAEPSPQPIVRARVQSPESREEESERTNESESQDSGAPDFDATFQAVCTAAGFNPRKPEHIASAKAQLQGWIDQGLDIEGTVLPSIRKTVANSDDPTSSLVRFNRLIGYSAARAAAAPAPAANGIPRQPVGDDDPDERITHIRAALRHRLGALTYETSIATIRFTIADTALIVTAPTQFRADWLIANLSERLGSEAQDHGFTRVEIGAL